MMARLFRYGLAAVGPVGSAVTQFLLSLLLLRLLEPGQFGSFAFLLVASQFSWGLWSALFCAPLPILLNRGDEASRAAVMRCLFSANLLVAAGACALFWIMAMLLKVPLLAAILFAAYGGVALLRWFARAWAYASGMPLRTTASDLVYSITLLAGVGLVAINHDQALGIAYAALLVSAVLGLIPFGWGYLVQQFGHFTSSAVRDYAAVWREHSGWSLLGVVTTEATANSHAYIVTALLGPTAFAPIAASALLIRPIGVAMNALTEFERAQMARQIGAGQRDGFRSSLRTFRIALIAIWVLTASAAVILFFTDPGVLFPPKYALAFLIPAAALWMAVSGVRLMRTPESALLQAAGAFRPLAIASVISSGMSVVAVLVLLAVGGTLWSIAGILMGEGLYAFWIWRQAARWLKAREGQHDDGPPLPSNAAVPANGKARPKRVMMIAPHFQEYSLLLANALSAHVPVSLMIERGRLDSEYAGRHMPLAPGVTLNHIGFGRLTDIVRIAMRLVKDRPSVIHVQEPSGLKKAVICAAIVALAKPFCTIALTVHDPIPHDGRDAEIARRISRFRNFIRNRAEIVFVHGEYCRAKYAEAGPASGSRVVTIDHGAILADGMDAAGASPSFNLLCFGRMEAYKGIEILCQAAEHAVAAGVDFNLAMAGGGPEMDRLERRFADLPNVTIHNAFIPSAELIAAMGRADCVALPYLNATQSGVLAAAFANGCFVIASQVGGIPDVVDHMVNGILVPPGDAPALTEAIRLAASAPELRSKLKRGAIETAGSKLDWNRVASEIWTTYSV